MTTADSISQTRPVALIGFRGSGKSTVGRELATLLKGRFVDTDDVIATQTGKSITAIFHDEGEDGFRRREREVIRQIVGSPPPFIGVGGGAVVDWPIVEALKKVATLVWLTARAEVLWERIAQDAATPETRPALTGLSGLQEVEQLLIQRTPYYQRAADIIIDTAQAKPRDIAVKITERLGLTGPT
jgi:shikimate kinase